MRFKQVQGPFDIDELSQTFRDRRLYRRQALEGGCVMYEQLLKWAGVVRLYKNGELFEEVLSG